MKKIFWYLNYKNITNEITGYGYQLNHKKVILTLLGMMALSIITGIIYAIEWYYLALMTIIIVLLGPFVIISYYRKLYAHERYKQLKQYMRLIMISFRVKLKIGFALNDIADSMEGEMKDCVKEALHRIDTYNGLTGQDMYHYALSAIEDKFPNSKLKNLHKLMIDIEKKSTSNQESTLKSLKYDINKWIERSNNYESELNVIRKSYIYAILICLIVEGVFVQIYRTLPELSVLLKSPLYQLVSVFFILGMYIIYVVSHSKLNGKWLYEDRKPKDHDLLVSYVQYLRTYDKAKQSKLPLILGIVIAIAGLVHFYTKKNFAILILTILICYLFVTENSRIYKKRFDAVRREIQKEFPNWMNSIATTLNDITVPRAIMESADNEEMISFPYLLDFIKEIEENPTGVEPYTNYLSEFNLEEVEDAMKLLYNIQKISSNDAEVISDLVELNQNMLEHAEELRNQDTIAAMGLSIQSTQILMMPKIAADLWLLISFTIQAFNSYMNMI